MKGEMPKRGDSQDISYSYVDENLLERESALFNNTLNTFYVGIEPQSFRQETNSCYSMGYSFSSHQGIFYMHYIINRAIYAMFFGIAVVVYWMEW